MPRTPTVFAALIGGLLALACQNEGMPLSSDPAIEVAGRGTCPSEIHTLIVALFPTNRNGKGGLENAAKQQCQNIQRQLAAGKTDAAIDMATDLVAFVLGHFDQLEEPGSMTKEEGTAELLSKIYEFVGLSEGQEIPPGAFTEEGAIAQCTAGEECRLITGTEFAGFVKPTGVGFLVNGQPFDGPVTFFIERLSDTADPFESFGFDDFPLFYHIGSIPVVTLTEEIGAGVCVVDPPDPFAPPTETIPFLRLAHIVNGQVEVTELADADFLDCSGASTQVQSFERGSGRALTPASPGKLGGAILAFSPFGAVDSRTGGSGTAPTVTVVSYPDTTFVDAGSPFQQGTFGFSDPDADVVEATVIETSDPNNTFTPDFDFTFDPDDFGDVFGQTSGTFVFGFGCPFEVDCLTGPVTFQMTLKDAAGNVSAPVSFSSTFVTTENQIEAAQATASDSPPAPSPGPID